jgi:ubiquinone/menaquinone biosynthesis C-methylase UbiE
MCPSKEHWESTYAAKAADRVSWFQPHAQRSLRLIEEAGAAPGEGLIDVGGGASTLVDDLLERGHSALSVLDVSAAALEVARVRLGEKARAVRWIEADITAAELPQQAYALWHDRAVFHFLTEAEQRRAYLANLLGALRPGGHLVVATFAEDGPALCSGLPVVRYSAARLQEAFGAAFTLLRSEDEAHRTPAGALQSFIYCYFRRADR